MRSKNYRAWAFTTALIFGALVVDQYTKNLALQYLTHTDVELSPFLNLILVWNSGIAFGMFASLHYSNIFFIVMSSIIVGIIFFLPLKDPENRTIYALIIAGAIGNIIDRMHYGAVLDFIDLHIGRYHWPAFNVADSLICLGAIFLLFDLTVRSEK